MSEQLTDRIEASGLNGWNGDFGGEIVGQENYHFLLRPIVESLPSKQKWTTLNLPKATELEKAAGEFEKEGYKNNTVLTLQAVSTKHRGFTESHSDRLWSEDNFDLAIKVDEGKSEELAISLGKCSYYEHLAWFKGTVEGLENPNGVLVSLQTVTTDNKLIFARRKSVSAGKDKIGIIGGTLDYPINEDVTEPEDVANGEATEELGISKDDVVVRLLTLMEDKYKRPVLFYRARLNLTSDEVKEKWLKNLVVNQEHSELYFVDNTLDGLLKFAREHSPSEFHAPADLIFQQALMQKINDEKDYEKIITTARMKFD